MTRDTRSDWELADLLEGVELCVGSKVVWPCVRGFPLSASMSDLLWDMVRRIATACAGVRSRSGGRLARRSVDNELSFSLDKPTGSSSSATMVTSFDRVGVSGAELHGVGLWPLIVEAGEKVWLSSKVGSGHSNSVWTPLNIVTKSSILAARNLSEGEERGTTVRAWFYDNFRLVL